MTLSPRQSEVLRHAAAGATMQATADALGLYVDTVREHRAKMRAKLGARSTHHAVAIALQRGLL